MSEIQIRFDGPPGAQSGRFIEVEDDTGKSIDFGEWLQDGDDWLLVFSMEDVVEALKTPESEGRWS